MFIFASILAFVSLTYRLISQLYNSHVLVIHAQIKITVVQIRASVDPENSTAMKSPFGWQVVAYQPIPLPQELQLQVGLLQ